MINKRTKERRQEERRKKKDEIRDLSYIRNYISLSFSSDRVCGRKTGKHHFSNFTEGIMGLGLQKFFKLGGIKR